MCCGKDMDDIVDEGDDFYEIQFIKSKSEITMCKKNALKILPKT